MKTSPIEIACMHHLEKMSKYQITAILNVPLFYVEKSIERFTESDVFEFESLKAKEIIKVKKRFKPAKKQELRSHVLIPSTYAFEQHFGHKKEAYWPNEMDYGVSKSKMSTTELIAKFN